MLLSVDVVEQPDRARVTAAGEVDLATAPQMDAAVQAQIDRGLRVDLDLSGVTFIDSTGLATLLRLHRAAESAGSRVQLVQTSSPVHKLLTLTGLDQVLLSGGEESPANDADAADAADAERLA